MFRSFFSLRKSKKVLRNIDRLYQRKWKVLDLHAKEKIITHLEALRSALKGRNGPEASVCSRNLTDAANRFMPQTAFEKVRNFVGAIGFALVIAIVIRQMWFELYSIPTGSMRPTLKESDFLVVSKTDFSVNVPLSPSHFYFDDSLVKRGSIVVWTGANMDIPDSDTVYFYLFPGKKLFVKRLMGKPGDTLYFYGGKIYGIDKHGNDLTELRMSDWSRNLEHIPFIQFDGKVETSDFQGQMFTTSTFRQMNLPVAKLKANVFGSVKGEMLGREDLTNYSDLWGMRNYAMARLLNQEQLAQMHPGAKLEKGLLYLELTHHPSLKDARLVLDKMNRARPDLGKSISLIPLQKEHVDAIANHMITCRFKVENGKAFHIGSDKRFLSRYFPVFNGVPDGTYEMQDGKAYRVFPFGITKELAKDHPLYSKDPAMVQQLYNLGIEFLTLFSPEKNSTFHPSRYAYFRDGALHLLQAPVIQKDDPTLIAFVNTEAGKKAPFVDMGAPLTADGKIDAEFIRKYGVVIPEKMYLMLGDNHAMSADSRQFGFVPQDNLKGVLSLLFSPPGSRFGFLPQSKKDHFTFPTIFVWGSGLLIIGAYVVYRRRKENSKKS